MGRKLNKKAGMEMSVNSIIVIVLAVIVLGFILTFVSRTFSSLTNKFEGDLKKEPEPMSPTLSNPITLSRDNVVADSGSTIVLKVGVYCSTSPNCVNVKPAVTCYINPSATGTTLTASTNNLILSQNFAPKTIMNDEINVFSGVLDLRNSAKKTYLCSVTASPAIGSKDMTIELR